MEADEHNYQTCTDENCEDCQYLIDEGHIMACDSCGAVGSCHVDWNSWRIMKYGYVLCIACYEESGEKDMFGD